MRGLVSPQLNWPEPPEPLPDIVTVSFCSAFEAAAFSAAVLDWSKSVLGVWGRAGAYDSAVGLRLQEASNTLATIRNNPAMDDEIALYTRAIATLAAAKEQSERDLNNATAELRSRSDLARRAEGVVARCLSDCRIAITDTYAVALEMPPGISITQIDSRGQPHLPEQRYLHVTGNPGDPAYHLYEISMRPGTGHCTMRGDGLHVGFALFGGAGVEADYFTVEHVAGQPPEGLALYRYGVQAFERLRVTFDNGQTTEADDWLIGPLVPANARRITRIEFVMNGTTLTYP